MQEDEVSVIQLGEDDAVGPDLELPESDSELSYNDSCSAHSLSLEILQRDGHRGE